MRAMLSGLLAAVLLLSLAACGQQETEPDTLGAVPPPGIPDGL